MCFGSEKEKVSKAFAAEQVKQVADLDHAVTSAFGKAAAGDIVLLAPGWASQDEFRDYRERGDQFIAAVGRLA